MDGCIMEFMQKVGVKWGKDKNLLIGSVLKFFPDRNYMDEDVIESLRKK